MKRTAAFLALFACLLSLGAGAAGPEVSAPSALLMEKETGTVLFAKGEHEKREIASVTKVMTLLLTMEAIDSGALSYDDTVTGSAHASSMGGSQIWLKEGEQMSVRELLKAVCIVSGNDAAVALGEHLAGSEDAFVQKMNERAAALGMNDTHFVNCTGLPAEGHLSSAHDVALMSRELLKNHPDIRDFTTVWMDSLRGGESMLVNTNKLIRFYDGATGLKTGSTDAARYCLAASAERDGMELIAVVLKGETSDQRFEDAKALLNYGFANYSLVHAAPSEVPPPIFVRLGTRGSVQPVLTQENTLLLEKGAVQGLVTEAELAEELSAPVAEGDRVGTLRVKSAEGETLAELPILAGESVPKVTFGQLFLRVLRTGACVK